MNKKALSVKLWIIAHLFLATTSTDIVMANSYEEAHEYKNAKLESEGYTRVDFLSLPSQKYHDHFNQEPSLYVMIYALKSEKDSPNQNPTKMAFEIYPKSFKKKIGNVEHVTSKDESTKRGEFGVSLKDDAMSLIKMPEEIYDINSNILVNNCLTMFHFISYEEEAPTVTVDPENEVVYLDFGEMENAMYKNGYVNHSMATLSSKLLYFDELFDTSRYPFVNIFCPFWLDSDSMNIEFELMPVMLEDVPYFKGRPRIWR